MKDFGRWFADFKLPKKEIARNDLLEMATELMQVEEVRNYLINTRGGCLCFVNPPCYSCSEPIDIAEAEDIFDMFPEHFGE